ncbi:metallophosphoesterase family protein [Prosthecomicrobium sp. N25]|uniref:metallophosphoesterase family protein n=1 Tax=Prosthecomicrobium sp. N25 TaxID=3129254 RepID=UPI0030778D68
MNFTFLHAADLHLGSPLTGLALKDPDVARRVALAGRQAFTALVDRALEERVAFVVIAGDVYDGEWKDTSIGLFFNAQVARLDRAGIPVFLVKGNHDADSVVTKAITLPAGVRVFGSDTPETVRLDGLRVALHGQSFADRAVTDNLARGYPAAVSGWFNIGLLHTALDRQSAVHAPYAPCSLADLSAARYDYWALGHLHEFEIVATRPHVVFPGNLQGRSVRECGPKGAVMVDVVDGAVAAVRPFHVASAVWSDIAVDLAGQGDYHEAVRLIERDLARAAATAPETMIAVRVRLTGATRLHRGFASDRESLRVEIQAAGLRSHPDLWIEKVVLATTDDEPVCRDGPLEALDLAALLAGVEADPDLRAQLEAELRPMAARLGEIDRDEPIAGDIDAILSEARALVLGRSEQEG